MQKRKKIAQYFKTKILSLLSLLPPGPISALKIQFLLQRAKNQIFCTVFDTHLIKAKKRFLKRFKAFKHYYSSNRSQPLSVIWLTTAKTYLSNFKFLVISLSHCKKNTTLYSHNIISDDLVIKYFPPRHCEQKTYQNKRRTKAIILSSYHYLKRFMGQDLQSWFCQSRQSRSSSDRCLSFMNMIDEAEFYNLGRMCTCLFSVCSIMIITKRTSAILNFRS